MAQRKGKGREFWRDINRNMMGKEDGDGAPGRVRLAVPRRGSAGAFPVASQTRNEWL